MGAAKKNLTLWAVLGPLTLGLSLALIFLTNYLSKKTVIITIHNRTGVDVQGGGIRLSSEPSDEEIGPIPDKDSTVFQFRHGGSGTYFLAGKLKSGADFKVTGGLVPKGKTARDGLVLEMQGDSVTGRFDPAAP